MGLFFGAAVSYVPQLKGNARCMVIVNEHGALTSLGKRNKGHVEGLLLWRRVAGVFTCMARATATAGFPWFRLHFASEGETEIMPRCESGTSSGCNFDVK